MALRLKQSKLNNRRPTRKRRLITLPELLRRGRKRHDIALHSDWNPLRMRRRVRTVSRPAVSPAAIPNLLTLCNGLCGILSIVCSANSIFDLSHRWSMFAAAALIFGGMFFDMMDGQVARRLKQSSLFGTQLDSLSDAVSFGAAPVFLLLMFNTYLNPIVLLLIGMVHFSCVLLRLARFNVQTDAADTHEFFTGLPSPAAAGIIASFAISFVALYRWERVDAMQWAQDVGPYLQTIFMIAAPAVTLIASLLMVSNICYKHVANRWRKKRMGSYQWTRTIIICLTVLTCAELALLLAFCLFAFEAPIQTLFQKIRDWFQPGTAEPSVAAEPSGDTPLPETNVSPT